MPIGSGSNRIHLLALWGTAVAGETTGVDRLQQDSQRYFRHATNSGDGQMEVYASDPIGSHGGNTTGSSSKACCRFSGR